ncbi:MAG TPA: Cro/Cl family transcriptional regulator [Firmicutes bacterium]|nr:Cro/Cl family transcriptional regulator [Bacillota bacterium]
MIRVFPEERHTVILNILNESGRCRVIDLARKLAVSEVTVRQDLDVLEKQGLLNRTHGGAILVGKRGFERSFHIEETAFQDEKARIGREAATLISDGETVILDVGTTVTEVARNLQIRKGLTVVTNALNIAMLLEEAPEVTVLVTGGTLRAKQHSLVNPFGQFVLDRVQVDVAFIGVNGIEAEHGVTNVNMAEAEMKSLFLKAARRRILVADSSKIGNVALAKVAGLQDIDLLITDEQADPEEVARLKDKGLEIKLV